MFFVLLFVVQPKSKIIQVRACLSCQKQSEFTHKSIFVLKYVSVIVNKEIFLPSTFYSIESTTGVIYFDEKYRTSFGWILLAGLGEHNGGNWFYSCPVCPYWPKTQNSNWFCTEAIAIHLYFLYMDFPINEKYSMWVKDADCTYNI